MAAPAATGRDMLTRQLLPEGAKPGRVPDRIVAMIVLVAAAPLFALIALAIVLESGFPVFFSQTRIGYRGKRFRLYKFRKFRRDIGNDGLLLTLANDRRMTVAGRFIERSKLDELPQFWNVLRGDMALVGPRPEVLDFADCFAGPAGRVLAFPPGIFGPSQAAFHNESSLYPPACNPHAFYREVLFPTKAAIDLEYYPNRTFTRDLLWIARCVSAVVGARPGLEPSPTPPPAAVTAETGKSPRTDRREAREAA